VGESRGMGWEGRKRREGWEGGGREGRGKGRGCGGARKVVCPGPVLALGGPATVITLELRYWSSCRAAENWKS